MAWLTIARIAAAVLALAAMGVAASSPLSATRDTLWAAGSLLGVAALALLPLQALLPQRAGRSRAGEPRSLGVSRWHRLVGLGVLAATLLHVAALYVVSPDDIGDALVLQAPTYSRLGMISAVLLIGTVLFALARRRTGLDAANWRLIHGGLAVAIVTTAAAHALMIRGALDGPVEIALCAAAGLAVGGAVIGRPISS